MKKSKMFMLGMLAMALVLGLSLAGCITFTKVSYEDTETSKEIFNAISELVPSKLETYDGREKGLTKIVFERKITAGELMSALIERFPGMTEKNIFAAGIHCTYQGKEYFINCSFDTTGAVSVVGKDTVANSIFSVQERVEPEQSES